MNSHRTKRCHQEPTTGDRIDSIGKVGREGRETGQNNGTQLSVSVKFLRQHSTNTLHAQRAAQCDGGHSVSCIHVHVVCTPLSAGAEKVGVRKSSLPGLGVGKATTGHSRNSSSHPRACLASAQSHDQRRGARCHPAIP